MQDIVHQKNFLATYVIIILLFISKVKKQHSPGIQSTYFHQLPPLDPPPKGLVLHKVILKIRTILPAQSICIPSEKGWQERRETEDLGLDFLWCKSV